MKLKIKNTIRFEILKDINKYKEKKKNILITLDDVSIILIYHLSLRILSIRLKIEKKYKTNHNKSKRL